MNSQQKISKLPFNDSTSSQHQINFSNNDSHSYLGQFKSIPSAAVSNSTATTVITTSANNSKANYANSKSMRNKLIRQDEANEIAECEESEPLPNLIANAVKKVEESKQDQDIIMMSTQTPLTNILEDEEEPLDEDESALHFKSDLNSCLVNSAIPIGVAGGSISSNSNPSILSNSRRSSRGGGEATNTIAALTILEEVESDHVSVNSFNNGTVRMSNSKLKLYPYSNKQNSDESKLSFIFTVTSKVAKSKILNLFFYCVESSNSKTQKTRFL